MKANNGSCENGHFLKAIDTIGLMQSKPRIFKRKQRRATVYYPIWWYDLPMPMWTFLEAYDLSGKTIIPYFTHNGSSSGAASIDTIEELCPNSTVKSDDYLSVADKSVEDAESEVKEWISKIGLSK